MNTVNVRHLKYLILFGIFCFIISYYELYTPFIRSKAVKSVSTFMDGKVGCKNESDVKDRIKILVWSSYFGAKMDNDERRRKLLGLDSLECRDWCDVLGDRKFANEVDALVWHGWPGDFKLSDLPKHRNPDQPWIWWSRESPYLTEHGLQNANNIFNWTMTYRHDSDIFYGYGQLVPLSNRRTINDLKWLSETAWIPQNTKLAVGVISKCVTPGAREKLVDLLIKHGLPVDMYGNCYTKIEETNEVFWTRLQKQYKFYLAFENALCADYVTEKLWRALKLGIVPVVYGSANYSREAPPNSFINVRDFNSSEELVNYLKMLAANPQEYAKYLEWRNHFRIEDARGFCGLCEKLRNKRMATLPSSTRLSPKFSMHKPLEIIKSRNVYSDLYNWWMNSPPLPVNRGTRVLKYTTRSACSKPEDEWFWKEL